MPPVRLADSRRHESEGVHKAGARSEHQSCRIGYCNRLAVDATSVYWMNYSQVADPGYTLTKVTPK